MFGLTFPQLGARPNATFSEKLQNETSAQMCVWCDSTMKTDMQYKALYYEYKFISISLAWSNEASHLKIHGTNNIHDSYSFRVIEASYIPSQCGNLQFRIAFRLVYHI
ncbi:hypothetical protein MTR_3g090635 [Medicago truncatula]|uniref:Uncharacterized protein n=1 Tax=Medicago truncatula TaxID=3880 RepID=A0A072V0V5_MEDTR|nr:hypothetical protein MTR_3g090635 [Medicago truncatula]